MKKYKLYIKFLETYDAGKFMIYNTPNGNEVLAQYNVTEGTEVICDINNVSKIGLRFDNSQTGTLFKFNYKFIEIE